MAQREACYIKREEASESGATVYGNVRRQNGTAGCGLADMYVAAPLVLKWSMLMAVVIDTVLRQKNAAMLAFMSRQSAVVTPFQPFCPAAPATGRSIC